MLCSFQDVLLEHQMHVGKVFSQKLSDQSLGAGSGCGDGSDGESSTNTPTDIEEMEEKEYGSGAGEGGSSLQGKTHFNFPNEA